MSKATYLKVIDPDFDGWVVYYDLHKIYGLLLLSKFTTTHLENEFKLEGKRHFIEKSTIFLSPIMTKP